jgi:excisionase family DNA binding protein
MPDHRAVGEDRVVGERRQPRYLTVGEAAKLLGVHRNTIHYRIKTGRVKAQKVDEAGRAVYRIDADSLGLRHAGVDVPTLDAQRPVAGADFVGASLEEPVRPGTVGERPSPDLEERP